MADPASLYARIRSRLDLNDSSYLDDNEIGQACEEAYFDLWDFLIDLLGDQGPWERLTLTTVANQDFVDVPLTSQVYRLLRLEFAGSGSTSYSPVRSGNLASDALETQPRAWSSSRAFQYYARRAPRSALATRQVAGGFAAWRFYFSPPPSAALPLRMYYVPPPLITFDPTSGDYTAFPDEFPEYVVADVCAKLTDKQEADSAPFVAERERIKTRIERYAKPHQMNGPHTIANMRGLASRLDNGDDWMRRR